jgi:hypothetical protein
MPAHHGGLIPEDIHAGLRARPAPATRLARRVRLHLESLIESRGSERPRIAEAPGFIAALREEIARCGRSDLALLRIEHVLLRAELQLCAHEELPEEEAAEVLARYREFTGRHAGELFDSLFEGVEARIEDDLYLAQIEHFNRLDFAGLRAFLEPDRVTYEGVIAAIKNHDLEDLQTKDTLFAKLLGTIGQASAFLACLEGDPAKAAALFEEAASFLRRDLQSLPRGTEAWVHGANLLCTLEWRRDRVPEATRWLAESLLLDGPIAAERVAAIGGAESLVSPSNPQREWILLNQLRLLARCIEKGALGPQAHAIEAALDAALALPEARYPRNLLLKWLLLLEDRVGPLGADRLDRAHALLSPPRTGTVDEAMRAIDLALLGRLASDAARSRDWLREASATLESLEAQEPGRSFLSRIPLARQLREGAGREIDPVRIAMALPYYFA